LKERLHMTNVLATRRSEQGFTLVELAIVMVIIGLLIGGILKGQELIANAKISSTVSQVKGLDAALNTFQDKYAALPGDITTPATRLPNCAAAPCAVAGNGNGAYDNVAGAAPALANEGVVAFLQLSAADLISGVDMNAAAVGDALPDVKAGGIVWLGASSATGTATGTVGTPLSANRSYAALNGSAVNVAGASGAFTPTVAAQIDRKLDDGSPEAGATQSVCGTGITGAGPTATYNESLIGPCAMYSRVLN
jgi:prepilin-type N-terminal cleavage/methylation domain-containing protein